MALFTNLDELGTLGHGVEDTLLVGQKYLRRIELGYLSFVHDEHPVIVKALYSNVWLCIDSKVRTSEGGFDQFKALV